MLNVIDYVAGTTVLHRLNPVSKLALATALILATISAQSLVALAGLLGLTFALATYANVQSRLLGLFKVLLPIAFAMFALQLLFVQGGERLWGFVSTEGIETGARACLRLVGVALPLVLMLTVTKLTDLANACVEVLHVPYTYAFTFTTALRFVPVFTQEMNAIMEAQTARGLAFDTRNPIKKMTMMLPVCIPLLVTSVSKTDAIALAAEQRGFYLRSSKSSYKRYPLRAIDWLAFACCAGIIAFGLML